MLLNSFLFVASIIIIIVSANLLTDGSVRFAEKLGVSPLIIGLTIVAFGTSAPELVVSLSSALNGSSDLALGNVLGSNIFNNLAVVGLVALIKPIHIQKSTICFELPLLLFGSFVLAFLALDDYFGVDYALREISRGDSLVLLSIFIVFIIYSLNNARKGRIKSVGLNHEAKQKANNAQIYIKIIAFILLGLLGLAWGGDLFVTYSLNLAKDLGINEGVLGLTLVACGTSLPELATSLVAAYKNETDLAVGNVVGSGIFNLFAILGLTGVIAPIKIVNLSELDLFIMLLSTLFLLIFGVFFGKRLINRWEGAMFFIFFLIYNFYLFGAFS